MGTLRSSEAGGTREAGALLFSGRADPTWIVPVNASTELMRVWADLKEASGVAPITPALGYRGCYLKDDTGREWFAFGGVVTLKTDGASESRRDEGRNFEQALLATAPEGVIPHHLI